MEETGKYPCFLFRLLYEKDRLRRSLVRDQKIKET